MNSGCYSVLGLSLPVTEALVVYADQRLRGVLLRAGVAPACAPGGLADHDPPFSLSRRTADGATEPHLAHRATKRRSVSVSVRLLHH